MTQPPDLWTAPPPVQQSGYFVPLTAPAQYGIPVPPPVPTGPAEDPRREVLAGLTTLLGCLFLGAPIGLIWAALRPNIDPFVVSAASESALKPQFSADMKLAGLGLAAGAVAGVVAWFSTRRHGVGVAVGLAVGGLLAMLVASHIGTDAAHQSHLLADTDTSLRVKHGVELTGTPQQQQDFINLLQFRLRTNSVLLAFSVTGPLVFALLSSVRGRIVDAVAPTPASAAAAPVSSGSAAAASAPWQAQR